MIGTEVPQSYDQKTVYSRDRGGDCRALINLSGADHRIASILKGGVYDRTCF